MILYYVLTVLYIATQICAEEVENKTWHYFARDAENENENENENEDENGNEVNGDDVSEAPMLAANNSAEANNELDVGLLQFEEGNATLQAAVFENADNISEPVLQSASKQLRPTKQKLASLKNYQAEKLMYSHDHVAQNWPLGIIPYSLDTKTFDNILATRVRSIMDYLESSSCLRFKSLEDGEEPGSTWINITNAHQERDCVHDVKVSGSGEVRLILGLDCLKRRDILHSLLHAIGFKDEVTHPYRDQYIRVMWENIQPRYLRLFHLARADAHSLVEYDPMSVMHFHDRAFSKNGRATVAPTMSGLQIQPSDKLSQLDKMKLRLTFGHECSRRTVDNLFDTCKSVLHDDNKDDEEDDKSAENEEKSREIKPLFTNSSEAKNQKKKDKSSEAKNPEEGKSKEIKPLFTKSSENVQPQRIGRKLKKRVRAGSEEIYPKKKIRVHPPVRRYYYN